MADIDKAPTPVLTRELASISDAVRAVGAPPTPVLDEPYAIRLIDPDADAATVSEWMNRPHVAEAWAYDWSPTRWRSYLAAQLGGEYSRPFIGSFRGTDICYIELYRVAKDCIAPRYAADPHDIGVHAAIADVKFVNRGVASTILPRMVANLFDVEPVAGASRSTRTTATKPQAGCVNSQALRSLASTTCRIGAWRSTCFRGHCGRPL